MIPFNFDSNAQALSPCSNHCSTWLVPIVLTILLLPLAFLAHSLFHTLIELFAIFIALMSFFVAWNTFQISRSAILLFLGCGYFWVGLLDLLHALSFQGMELIPGLQTGASIQFWILARFFEALVLLAASASKRLTTHPRVLMCSLGLLAISGIAAEFVDLLPVMFVVGEGLTKIKIISEYVIICLFFFAGVMLYRNKHQLGTQHTRLVLIAIAFTIAAELSFTLYNDFYEVPMILGHVFKLFSFWMIYRVLIESALHQPVQSLSRIVDSYDAASDETAIIDQRGRLLQANHVARKRVGNEINAFDCHEVFHDPSISKEECVLCRAIKEGKSLQTYEFFHKEDEAWYEVTLSGIHFGDNFSAMIHSRRCITDRKLAEQQLANLNRLYMVLSQTNKAVVKHQEPYALFNDICEIAVRYGEFKMVWIGIIDGAVVRPEFYAGEETGYLKEMQMRVDDSALAKGPVGRAAKTKSVACVNSVDTDPDFGPWREAAQLRGYKALAAVPIKSKSQVIGIFTLYSARENVFDETMLSLLSSLSDDMSAAYRHFQQAQLQQEADDTIRKLSSAIEQGVNAILIANIYDEIEYVNQGFSDISGFHREEVIGAQQSNFMAGLHHFHVYQEICHQVAEKGHWQGEVLNKKQGGGQYWSILSVSCIRNEVGMVTHYLWSSTDNTKLHEAQETINRLAFYDSLTGLANRRLLMDRLDHALIGAKRHGEMVAVMMCDLDNFKLINDSLGHDAGDQLLQHIASILKRFIREDDLVSRLGGDEFVVVLDGVAEVGAIVRIANSILSELEKPLSLMGNQVAVSSSIGIAISPQDADNSSQLLRNADLAMYHAKQQGKNRFQFFQNEMNEKAQGRLSLENRLRKALAEDAFDVWYQPQVNIVSGQITGFEALIRWQENGAFIPPNEFIPLAEETGLIEVIGDYVLRKAHKDWLRMQSRFPNCSMAVNVSAYQFRKTDHLFEVIQELIQQQGQVDRRLFIIELTESTLIQDVEVTIKTLGMLKSLGLSLSIDDFGTGYSSLSRLKQFPIDQLKIDRSFIKDLLEDQNDKAIVSAIIAIAQALELKLVAEGVEMQAQADLLLSSGCDLAQGFRYYKPMRFEDILLLEN